MRACIRVSIKPTRRGKCERALLHRCRRSGNWISQLGLGAALAQTGQVAGHVPPNSSQASANTHTFPQDLLVHAPSRSKSHSTLFVLFEITIWPSLHLNRRQNHPLQPPRTSRFKKLSRVFSALSGKSNVIKGQAAATTAPRHACHVSTKRLLHQEGGERGSVT